MIYRLILSLNDCPIRNHTVLRYEDDAVANEVCAAWSISFNHSSFVQQPRILPDARILIDDCTFDDSSLPYPNARHALAQIGAHLVERLIEVGAHDV